jgi:hypothetical protein
VQLNSWHFYVPGSAELDVYIDYSLHDVSMPRIDISAWTETIVRISELSKLRLNVILSADSEQARCRMENCGLYSSTEREKALAKDIEKRLNRRVDSVSTGRDVAIQVRYIGTDQKTYRRMPC